VARGLDHIVHAVRDLDAAADFYRRLGFTVGPRNRHPWGTHNHIVQLPGFFIEILTFAEPDKLGGDGFSLNFGGRNRDFLKSREGLSFVILESKDVEADARAFEKAGIAASQALSFTREGKRPDGTPVTVGFSLAFARDAMSPLANFAVCRQHNPDLFWNTTLQKHANGAVGIAGAVLAAENPTDHHIFLSAFVGERDIHSSSSGVSVMTPRGAIQIFDPTAFRDRYGVTLQAHGEGASIAAIRVAVADPITLRKTLRDGGIAVIERGLLSVVAPQDAFGATLIFEGVSH
jgi:catechol 2,3-dioxygenase-like lactoylglutathione lyase family enzyme